MTPVLPSKASKEVVILLHSWMIRLQKTISNLPRNYGRDFSPGKQIVVPRLCKSISFQKHDHKSTSKSSSQTWWQIDILVFFVPKKLPEKILSSRQFCSRKLPVLRPGTIAAWQLALGSMTGAESTAFCFWSVSVIPKKKTLHTPPEN